MKTDIERYRDALRGSKLAHAWRGHGSALFLEFGELTSRSRQDGSPGNPEGELGVMIEWSWRIERAALIVCGSSSEEDLWEPSIQQLEGQTITDVELFGQITELVISLSGGYRVVSFMTAEGDPQWTLFDRRSDPSSWLYVQNGTLTEGGE